MDINKIYNGNCLEVLKTIPENFVDAVVTDPPYELGFMGKAWDKSGIAYNIEMWREALRVLKPGGHLLSFSSSRLYFK
jgi:site-specific DNA-methyltransferase (adenine-specific)